VGLAPEDAFSTLPSTLRNDLLSAFNQVVSNYREHKWEPSELNGGKLCEAVYTIIEGWLVAELVRLLQTWKQQALVLLLTEAGYVPEADLFRWLEHLVFPASAGMS
jgi:hypothetical protein